MVCMMVVGAAFTSATAARAAQRELIDQLAIDPGAVNQAPLGAVGRRSEGRLIVAARIPRRDLPEATQILERHGGKIVTRAPIQPHEDGIDWPAPQARPHN